MVNIFSKTIPFDLSNYTPHETVNFDDQNPTLISSKIKNLIELKNDLHCEFTPNIQHCTLLVKLQRV